jgi:ribosomal protein RSM22 (predicted rRNA methylase)
MCKNDGKPYMFIPLIQENGKKIQVCHFKKMEVDFSKFHQYSPSKFLTLKDLGFEENRSEI